MTIGRANVPAPFQLFYVLRGRVVLRIVQEEDIRSVLLAYIGTLAIELSRIMCHEKEDAKNLRIRDLPGIEAYLDDFSVVRDAGDHQRIVRGSGGAAGIARDDVQHAPDRLEHRLDSPKTPTRQHSGTIGQGSKADSRGRDGLAQRLRKRVRPRGRRATAQQNKAPEGNDSGHRRRSLSHRPSFAQLRPGTGHRGPRHEPSRLMTDPHPHRPGSGVPRPPNPTVENLQVRYRVR